MIFIVVNITIIGCAQEMTVEEYQNLSEVMAKGAAGDRGWVPRFVPASSTSLKIAYNIETNEVWLMFQADSKDLTRMLKECSTPKAKHPRLPRKIPSVLWWPESLTSTSSKVEEGWNFFACEPHGAGAIDLTQGNAYYWRFSG